MNFLVLYLGLKGDMILLFNKTQSEQGLETDTIGGYSLIFASSPHFPHSQRQNMEFQQIFLAMQEIPHM